MFNHKLLLCNMVYLIHILLFHGVTIALIKTTDADHLIPPNHVDGPKTSPLLPDNVADTETLLFRTLNSLDKGVAYMATQYSHINLDGVIGTRIVEGQLKVTLDHITSGDYTGIPHDANIQIRQIIQAAGDVSELTTFFVQMQQKEYYKRIGGILAKDFWTLDYPPRITNPDLVSKPLYPDESMREKDSDDCLTELLGTDGHSVCDVSDHCWTQMTSPGYRYYSLSHELFYLQIGQSAGCFKGDFLLSSDRLVEGFCANMLREVHEIQHAGYPVIKRDLFMEQQALCGMAGFQDFISEDWLDLILSWQWQDGCWGQKGLKPNLAEAGGPSRVKREEKVLSGGCESHRTAVAISALSQYVRYLLAHISQLRLSSS